MKMIYIANARIPTERAHGIQIMEMCAAFARHGVSVELVVPKRFNTITDSPFEYYGVSQIFEITRLPTIDLVRFGRIGFWVQSITFAVSTFFYCTRARADVVYSRDELPLYFLSFKRIPFWWEAHMPRWNFLIKRVIRNARMVVTISVGLRSFFVQKGVPEECLLTAPDGVDINRFATTVDRSSARRTLGLPEGKKLVAYTGHLYDWKGARTLALSAAFLPEETSVLFVGGTEQDISQFKEEYGNNSPIIILGRRPYSEIPLYMRAADVLVLPNTGKSDISAKFTSPLKLFEYMASGTPIVASDLPSVREILSEDNAFLVNPDNPQNMSETIEHVLGHPQEAVTKAERAWEDVSEYTWDKRAEKILRAQDVAL